jgi:hypothetical protein
MRATASVPPPAPHGTINVIGRSGQVCACTPAAAATMALSSKPRLKELNDGRDTMLTSVSPIIICFVWRGIWHPLCSATIGETRRSPTP